MHTFSKAKHPFNQLFDHRSPLELPLMPACLSSSIDSHSRHLPHTIAQALLPHLMLSHLFPFIFPTILPLMSNFLLPSLTSYFPVSPFRSGNMVNVSLISIIGENCTYTSKGCCEIKVLKISHRLCYLSTQSILVNC